MHSSRGDDGYFCWKLQKCLDLNGSCLAHLSQLAIGTVDSSSGMTWQAIPPLPLPISNSRVVLLFQVKVQAKLSEPYTSKPRPSIRLLDPRRIAAAPSRNLGGSKAGFLPKLCKAMLSSFWTWPFIRCAHRANTARNYRTQGRSRSFLYAACCPLGTSRLHLRLQLLL